MPYFSGDVPRDYALEMVKVGAVISNEVLTAGHGFTMDGNPAVIYRRNYDGRIYDES